MGAKLGLSHKWKNHILRVFENRVLRIYIWTQGGGSGGRLEETA
jgi:hypothetical protein